MLHLDVTVPRQAASTKAAALEAHLYKCASHLHGDNGLCNCRETSTSKSAKLRDRS